MYTLSDRITKEVANIEIDKYNRVGLNVTNKLTDKGIEVVHKQTKTDKFKLSRYYNNLVVIVSNTVPGVAGTMDH